MKQYIKHVLLLWQIACQWLRRCDVRIICDLLVEPYNHFKHFLSTVLSAAVWKCKTNPLTPAGSRCFIVKHYKIVAVSFEGYNIDQCQYNTICRWKNCRQCWLGSDGEDPSKEPEFPSAEPARAGKSPCWRTGMSQSQMCWGTRSWSCTGSSPPRME